MKKNMVVKILIIGLLLGLFAGMNYFILIPLNLRYTETFVLFLAFIVIAYLIFFTPTFSTKTITVGKDILEAKIPDKKPLYIISVLIVVFIIYQFSSSPIFFSKKYQKLIGNVEEKNFTEDFKVTDTNNLPIVDNAYAQKLGDKKLGSDRGLGSEFHVGEFSNILVNGKMYQVAPLEFNGFFKWINNKSTPGYVLVDSITGEVELVTEVNGKKLEMKYLTSAFFNSNVKRHAYFNGNMDNALISYTFEIDDEGNPYYIINKTHKTIGINGGDDIKSVVVVNIQTGEVKEYEPSKAPKWVDTIYPNDLVMKQLDDWGLYVNGFWNTIFGEKDIVRNTPGTRKIYNDNSMYHYTGMTSSGSDESTVGFGVIDTRTKHTTFYKMTGATEQAAMNSAQGKVENYGYNASFPIPINVNDEETFFITLKDSKGLIKQYAFVNIEDYSIVGNGETISSAIESYQKGLNKDYIPNDKDNQEISGTVTRIGYDVNQGNSTYYIVLDNGKLYYGNSSISKEINVTKESDQVKMVVNNNKIVKFDNQNVE